MYLTYNTVFAVIEELNATGKFDFMDLSVDEAVHSMEMHLPYLSKVFQGYFLF
jgi:predicted class III extradiol MEMO1 family dioxygenase